MISAVADHLVQSTLIAAAAWVLTLALRRNGASVRHAVWLAASAKFVMPFAVLMAIGSQFGWRTAPPPAPAEIRVVVTRSTPAGADHDRLFTLPVAPPASPAVPATAAATPQGRTALFDPRIWPVLFAVWICGALALAAIWVVKWRSVAAVVRDASPFESGRELTALRRLEASRGMRRPLALMATDEGVEPGVFGILKPVLVWPRSIGRHLTDGQIEAILGHELSHVRRRDNLTAAIHMAVQAIFWFHPLVWWLGARLVDERERACDEDVIRDGAEPQVYAEGILKTCEFYLESPMVCVTGVTGSDLKKRIEQIMRSHSAVALSSSRKILLTACGTAAVAAPIIVGAATAPVRSAPIEKHVIQSRRFVFADTGFFDRHVDVDVKQRTTPKSAAPAVSQGGSSSSAPSTSAPPALSGTVRGPKGSSVKNATITLTHVATNIDVALRTDSAGRFDVPRLPPGEYLFGVTSDNLEPFHGRVTIAGGQPAVLTVTLQPRTFMVNTTVSNGFPGPPGTGPRAPLPSSWICADRPLGPMGRVCGPPSLLEELERDLEVQAAARQSMDTAPALPVKTLSPRYPQELWDAMIEGSVVIEGRIGEDGVPTGLEVTAPVHPDFAKAALDAVSQWRFEPARQDGGPISVPLKASINFRLHP